jgi:hypothetical protein
VKLEYLPDGSADCPLIRLFEFDQSEAQRLRQLVKSLVVGDRQDVALQNEEWVKSIGKCSLNLRRGNSNQGVRQAQGLKFECVLSPDGWSNVEGLLEPFCESNTAGFQWLTHDGSVALLISQSGQW